jgi:hypothetical protein
MKKSIKFSENGIVALQWWVMFVMNQKTYNYHERLLQLVLRNLWEKKVHPKTAYVRECSIKFSEMEHLALSLSFMAYDHFDAPLDYQAELYHLASCLPKLRYDQPALFLTPPNRED